MLEMGCEAMKWGMQVAPLLGQKLGGSAAGDSWCVGRCERLGRAPGSHRSRRTSSESHMPWG